MFKLPASWSHATLADCVEILDTRRKPINADERAERTAGKSDDELYPYYGATGQVGWIDGYIFDEEVVLLGEDGAPFLDSSKAKAYLISGKTWVNNHAHVIRARVDVTSNRYICHFLNLFDYSGLVTGTTRLKLTQAAMASIPIPLAPIGEQQAIVEHIETQFTRLDAAEAALKRVQANLRRYRAAVLKAACEGRLVPTEAELAQAEGRTYEPAAALLERILAERRAQWQADHPGKKYKEPAGPDVNALPELPEGWCWATVEQLLAEPLMNGHSVNTADDGFPVLRLTAIRNGSIALEESKLGAWTAEQASAYLVKKNDFFVSRGNGSLALVGRGGLVEQQPEPVAFPDTMIRLVTSAAVNQRYLRAIWDSLLVREQIERSAKTTAGIHKINQQDIGRYVLPLPPVVEQAAITDEIEHQMSTEQALTESLSTSLRRAERLRQSILQLAFTGQLVTNSIH